MGGGNAPAPDPNIGIAALNSSQTGQAMLEWMQSQAEVTNQWAEEDRSRYVNTFQPLQDQFIAEAGAYDTPERRAAAADAAAADVSIQGRLAGDARRRSSMAMGIDPRSGRYATAEAKAGTDLALAGAGAKNLARRQVEDTGRSLRANAINLGQGMAVNPGTSMGLSNGAGQAGFGGAMQGYGQQGNLLNTQYQQQLQQWEANQSGIGALGGALGSIAGLFWRSSKKIKHDMKPANGNMEALDKMPVEEWTYNEGEGDGRSHIGPYAEDFAKATGKGDGKTINVIDAIGVTMGAVKELGAEVKSMKAMMKPMGLPSGMRMAA